MEAVANGIGVPGAAGLQSGLAGIEQDVQRRVSRLGSGRQLGGAENARFAALIGIAQRFATQESGLRVAAENVNLGARLIQHAEAGLSTTTDLLQRARELAVQAASGTVSDTERAALQTELDQVVQEIDRTALSTQLNTRRLLDGSDPSLTMQAGATSGAAERIALALPQTTSAALGVGGASISTQAGAQATLDQIDTAIEAVSEARSGLGAQASRLAETETALRRAEEDFASARSRIEDTDVAAEAAALLRDQLRQQVDVALLAQANVSAFSARRLLDPLN
jgi:flagellin